MGKKNDNTLVKNASFLMIAALISKIIGMLYKSPTVNAEDPCRSIYCWTF